MEGHAWRSIPHRRPERRPGLAAALAAETLDWPVGTAGGVRAETIVSAPVPAPSRSRDGRMTGARVPFVVAIVVALVLGTTGFAYAQTATSRGGPERGVLDSAPFVGPVAADLDTSPPDGDRAGSGSGGDLGPGELLDDIAGELERAASKLAQLERQDDPATDPGPASGLDGESASGPASGAGSNSPVGGPADADPSVVHLTFDDGPHPVYTPAVLDVLARHDAKATFFVLGSLAEAHPELIDRIVGEGHTVANHTWNHDDLAPLTHAEFNETVLRTQAALGPHATPCLRPPFGSLGATTRSWAAELGLELVLWDTDTLDWRKPGVDAIADSIVGGASGGSPILLHDAGGDRTQTIAALDRALRELSGEGLSFEPIC